MINLVFIGIIVFLISICIYIYITKNQEIDDLTQQSSKVPTAITVDLTTHNNCMSELNTLRNDLRETQEQNFNSSLSVISNLAAYAAEELTALNNIRS